MVGAGAGVMNVRSEPEHYTGRVAHAVLAIAEAAGESGQQRIGGIELRTQEVHLGDPDRKMPGQAKIDAATEGHGEGICAGQAGGKSTDDRNIHARP